MYLCLPEFVETDYGKALYLIFLISGTIFDFKISAD